MEVITKYIAKDGKEFIDKDDCLEYEKLLAFRDITGEYLFIDFCGNKMDNNVIIENFSDTKYIFVKTDEAAEVLQELLARNYDTPWDKEGDIAGAWLSDEDGNWVSLTSLEEKVSQFRYYAPEWVD